MKLFTLDFSLFFKMYYHVKCIKFIWNKAKLKRLVEMLVKIIEVVAQEVCILLTDSIKLCYFE